MLAAASRPVTTTSLPSPPAASALAACPCPAWPACAAAAGAALAGTCAWTAPVMASDATPASVLDETLIRIPPDVGSCTM